MPQYEPELYAAWDLRDNIMQFYEIQLGNVISSYLLEGFVPVVFQLSVIPLYVLHENAPQNKASGRRARDKEIRVVCAENSLFSV